MNNEPFNIVVSGVGGQGTVLAGKLLAQCALAEGAFVRSAETIGMAQRGGSVLGHIRILSAHESSEDSTVALSPLEPGAGDNNTHSPLEPGAGDNDTYSPLVSKGQVPQTTGADSSVSSALSPLVPKGQAQLLIGFEPAETLKAYSYCAPHALVVTATAPLFPPMASLQRVHYDGVAQLEALSNEYAKGHIASLVTVDNASLIAQLGLEKALNVVLLGAALAALEKNEEGNHEFLRYETMQRTIEATVKPPYVKSNLQALEMGYRLLCT